MKTKNYRSTSRDHTPDRNPNHNQGGRAAAPSGAECLSLPLDLNRKSPIQNRKLNRRHQVARTRAAWWFGQMRKAVNAAVEWKPAPLARPEQTYIPLGTSR